MAKIGNEEQMQQVRDLMSKAGQVNLGDKLEKGVEINFESAYGTKYEGIVVFKRPNMQDYMRMGAIKAQFLGENGMVNPMLIDETIRFMAQAMSTLKVVILRAPEWLLDDKGNIDVESIVEPDVLYHIYYAYEDWEDTFRKGNRAEVPGDSQTSK